jgi:sulfate permease, SulP family
MKISEVSDGFFPTLHGYRASWLLTDLLTGLTLTVIFVPGAIAISRLVDMPATTGLYATIASCLMVAMLSRSRYLMMAADSTIAPVFSAGIVTVAAAGSPEFVGLVITATALAGIILLVIGISKLGWIADYLSRSVLTGFLAGVSITIIVSQLPGLLGLEPGDGHVLRRMGDLVVQLPKINWPTAVLGLVGLVIMLVCARISLRIPAAFIVLVLSVIAEVALNLADFGVDTLGDLTQGWPSVAMPDLSITDIRLVSTTALSVAMVAMVQTAATSRSAAEASPGGVQADVDGDFRALGAGNILASLVGGFATNASPSGTALTQSMRAKSQLPQIVCGLLILFFVLMAGEALRYLPTATLSAVLIFMATRIFRVSVMKKIWDFSKLSFSMMLFTFVAVLMLGVELGVLSAVIIAILDRTRRASRPELLPIMQKSDGGWRPTKKGEPDWEGGMVAFRLNGPLWFGNANWFRQEMMAALKHDPAPAILVFDGTGTDDLDFTGVSTLEALALACKQRGVHLVLLANPGLFRTQLYRGGIVDDVDGAVFKSMRAFMNDGVYRRFQAERAARVRTDPPAPAKPV